MYHFILLFKQKLLPYPLFSLKFALKSEPRFSLLFLFSILFIYLLIIIFYHIIVPGPQSGFAPAPCTDRWCVREICIHKPNLCPLKNNFLPPYLRPFFLSLFHVIFLKSKSLGVVEGTPRGEEWKLSFRQKDFSLYLPIPKPGLSTRRRRGLGIGSVP